MEKIGQIICTYRKLNGISQEELAGIVGVSAGAVSKWERDTVDLEFEITKNQYAVNTGRSPREKDVIAYQIRQSLFA